MGSPHAGSWEKCEEEGVAEMKCYGVTTTSISLFLQWHVGKRGRGAENEGTKPCLGKRFVSRVINLNY